MSFPIGFPPVARQPAQTTDPGPGASDEARVSFVQSLSKLGEYDRRLHLSSLLVDAARNGDVQTISQLNSVLDGRDQMVLTEALEAAAKNGHGEIINIMFRGRAWLGQLSNFQSWPASSKITMLRIRGIAKRSWICSAAFRASVRTFPNLAMLPLMRVNSRNS